MGAFDGLRVISIPDPRFSRENLSYTKESSLRDIASLTDAESFADTETNRTDADRFALNREIDAMRAVGRIKDALALEEKRAEIDGGEVSRGTMPNDLFAGLKVISMPSQQKKRDLSPESIAEMNKGQDRSWSEFAGDVAIKAGQGAIGLGQAAVGIGDIVTGGLAGKALDAGARVVSGVIAGDSAYASGYEPQRASQIVNTASSEKQRRMEQDIQIAGEGKGFIDGFADTFSAIAKNPSSIPGYVVESMPMMLASGGGAKALAERIFMRAGGGAAGTAAVEAATGSLKWAFAGGEGALTAGQIADQARENGRTWTQYVLPAIAAGAGTTLIGRAAGAIPGLGDAETAAFTGATRAAATGNRAVRTVKGAGQEGFIEELPQSVQEQMFTNIANGKPFAEGLGAAGAQGLVTGAAMGAGFGAFSPAREQDATKPPIPPTIETVVGATDIDTAIDAAKTIAAAPINAAANEEIIARAETLKAGWDQALAEGGITKDQHTATIADIDSALATTPALIEATPIGGTLERTLGNISADAAIETQKQSDLDKLQAQRPPPTLMEVKFQEAQQKKADDDARAAALEIQRADAAQSQAAIDAKNAAIEAAKPQLSELPILQKLESKQPLNAADRKLAIDRGYAREKENGFIAITNHGHKSFTSLRRSQEDAITPAAVVAPPAVSPTESVAITPTKQNLIPAPNLPSANIPESLPVETAAPTRLYLNVPFASKDNAKKAGAKWDAENKLWYAEPIIGGVSDGKYPLSLTIPFYQVDASTRTREKGPALAAALNLSATTGIPHIAVQELLGKTDIKVWRAIPASDAVAPAQIAPAIDAPIQAAPTLFANMTGKQLKLQAKAAASQEKRDAAQMEIDRRVAVAAEKKAVRQSPGYRADKLTNEARKDLWREIKRAGGIRITEASELGIDPRSVPGYRASGFLHKDGMSIDGVAAILLQRGIVTQDEIDEGGDKIAYGIISNMLAGEFVGTPEQQNELHGLLSAANDENEIRLAAIAALTPEHQEINTRHDEDSSSILEAAEIEVSNESNATHEDLMRALGYSEQEIADDIATREQARAQSAADENQPAAAASAQNSPPSGAAPPQQGAEVNGNARRSPQSERSIEAASIAEEVAAAAPVNGQPAGATQARPTQPFIELEGQSAEEVAAANLRANETEKAETKRKADEKAKEDAEKLAAEVKSRNDAANAAFALGQSAEDNLSGQGGLLPQPEIKKYEYGLTLRPVSTATVPKGFTAFGTNPAYPHGTVIYNKPLLPSQIESFDLAPFDPQDPINLRKKYEERERIIMDAFEEHGMVRGVRGNGNSLLLTVSPRGGYRVTDFTKTGEPSGHREYDNLNTGPAMNQAAGEMIGDEVRILSQDEKLPWESKPDVDPLVAAADALIKAGEALRASVKPKDEAQAIAADDGKNTEDIALAKFIIKELSQARGYAGGNFGKLTGSSGADARQRIMSQILGRKVSKSSAGITALEAAMRERFGIDDSRMTSGAADDALLAKIQSLANTSSPQEVSAATVSVTPEIQSAISGSLTEQDRTDIAVELGARAWSAQVADRFTSEFADWLATGRSAAHRLAVWFEKVARNMAATILAAAVAIHFSPQTISTAQAAQVPVTTTTITRVIEQPRANLQEIEASPEVKMAADWQARKEHGEAFIIADKKGGLLFAFDSNGVIIAKTPALFGKTVGDTLVAGSENKTVAETTDAEKITPAGEFIAQGGTSYGAPDVMFAKYSKTSINIHTVYLGNPKEKRLDLLNSPSGDDNHVTYGCVNVPPEFANTILLKYFSGKSRVVILPEQKSLVETFPDIEEKLQTKTETIVTGGDRTDSASSGIVYGVTPAIRRANKRPLASRSGIRQNKAREPNAPYTTDLFGEPVEGLASAQPARAGVSRNVQPAGGLQDTVAPLGVYQVRTSIVSTVKRQLGARIINTANDLAKATHYLYKSAVERFDAIVTDKNGKPLGIVGSFKGAIGETAVYPSTVLAEAVRIPSAANIWFSHNHPSGKAELSAPDRNISSKLENVFLGSGIQARGIMAVTGKQFVFDGGDGQEIKGVIPVSIDGPSVPVIERELHDPDIEARFLITSPGIAKAYIRDTYQSPGVILLDNQNRVAGFVPIDPGMGAELRHTGGLNAIYRAISEANAAASIVAHAGEYDAKTVGGAQRIWENIAGALSQAEAKPIDVIRVKNNGAEEATLTSYSEHGFVISENRVMASRGAGSGLPAAEVQRVASIFSNRIKVAATFNDLPQAAKDAFKSTGPNGIRGVYLPLTDEIWLVAANLNNTTEAAFVAMHEGVHRGLLALFGNDLKPILNQIWLTNKSVREEAARYMTKYKIDRLEAIEEVLADKAKLGEAKDLKGWDKLVAFIKAWASDLGEKLGIKLTFTDAMVDMLVASAQRVGLSENPQVFNDEIAAKYSSIAPTFYSELEAKIGAIKGDVMPAQQWKMSIKNLAGVKSDEIEWSGINDWLDTQTGNVAKADILDYLSQNGVKVDEVMLADDVITDNAKYDDFAFDEFDMPFAALTQSDQAYIRAGVDGAAQETYGIDNPAPRYIKGSTKFNTQKLALPGGENYRELLLTLPDKKSIALAYPKPLAVLPSGYDVIRDSAADRRHQFGVIPSGQMHGKFWAGAHPSEDAARTAALKQLNKQNNVKAADQWRKENEGKAFRSRHFDQLNILANIRFNERTDAAGKRVLFIEEIQSDWAQRGRKEGFGPQDKYVYEWVRKDGTTESKEFDTAKERKAYVDEVRQRSDFNGARLSDPTKGVPSAPFVGKTEAWVSLALKRMIRYAAENGFDRVAWTTGEQQANRYSLDKHVGKVTYVPEVNGGTLLAADKGGNSFVIKEANVAVNKIADYVGKDVAEKLMAQPIKDGSHNLVGDALRVPQAGMRAFYDKIVLNVANEVLKKLGGGRVGEVSFQGESTYQREWPSELAATAWAESNLGGHSYEVRGVSESRGTFGVFNEYTHKYVPAATDMRQPGFDITPALREKAMQGMPLFSRAVRNVHPDGLRKVKVGDSVDGLEIREGIPNQDSIDASLGNNTILRGIREVPLSAFDQSYLQSISRDALDKQTRKLADEIEASGEINPLIVAFDSKGAYIIEGGHRFDALIALGKNSIPAMVVIDESNPPPPFSRMSDQLNTGTDIRASRTATTDLWDIVQSAKTPAQAREVALGMMENVSNFGLWDKTVGTSFNKARKNPFFARVFNALQTQQDNTAAFAIEAEAEAVDVLARMSGSTEIKSALKSSFSGERGTDLAAVSKAVFANIEGQEGVQQKIFTDKELADEFNLNDRQIRLYRQSRAAIDQSLDRYAQSIAVRVAQKFVRTSDLTRAGLDETVSELVMRMQLRLDVFEGMKDNTPQEKVRSLTMNQSGISSFKTVTTANVNTELEAEIQAINAAMEKLPEIQETANNLKEKGYAPAMRFGKYAVTGKWHNPRTGEKDVEFFTMVDSKIEANILRLRLKNEHPTWEVTAGEVDTQSFKKFQGISPDTLELFARFMNVSEDAAFKEYIALATSSRSAMKRMLERKGIAGFSENLPRVISAFITSNSRAAAKNINGLEITDALESVKKEIGGDVSNEAYKLDEYVNNPSADGANIRSFMFAYFLGGSVAGAIVNITQPVMVTAPYLFQYVGLKTSAIMARASKLAVTGKVLDKDLRSALDRALAEGVTDNHEYYQLMQEATSSQYVPVRAAMKAWGSLFSAAETFNRRITFIAAYEVAKEMTPAQLSKTGANNVYEFAKNAVNETQFIYAKHNRPNWARGPVGALLMTFKQFSISYLEFFNRLPTREKMIALGLLVLMAGLEGLPFAEDLEDLIDTIGQKMGYGTNTKKKLRQMAVATLGEAGADFALHGISGIAGMPMDVAGRLSMGNLIPGTKLFNPSAKDKGREIMEIAGPAGSVAKKFLDAADQGKVREALPKAFSDANKAYEMFTTNEYRDTRGRKVMSSDATDAAMKLIGFQPQSVAAATRHITEQMRDVDTVRRVESEIAEQWADGIRNKNADEAREARERLKQWNIDNPDLPIRIKLSDVLKRAKQANMTRDQRFYKTASPEMRRQFIQEAAH